ncbi:FecR family protein [Xanthocytophaga agilis]|uniref:FecR domain-containing protein n=1 Tax=Xanthocytophaga agilis TaxID=3048010 RepID=A0AAE3UG06_9BACT|nr:FecR domain-containing protein [Xanthocytophaga agilis]MDJ1504403.1 FecR domain-containing protein [Xanthocytophaga agilis]
MKYTNYSVEDFVADEFFQQWVKAPQPIHQSFWSEWLKENPHKAEEVEDARRLVAAFIVEADKSLDQQAKNDLGVLWNRIDDADVRSQSSLQSGWLKMAAVFIGFLVIAGVAIFFYSRWSMVQYATDFGKTQKFILPDGSEVVLNGNSQISFSKDWTAMQDREVWIQGEAFFHVAKQKTHSGYRKFIVHTSNVAVEVLGTQFDVNNRRELTRVVLSEGSVRLQPKQITKPFLMVPGDLVELSKKHSLMHRKVNPGLYSAWTQGELNFEKESLADIAQLLEDNYGYQILFSDSTISTRRFSGSASVTNINNLLIKLSKSHNLRITRQGKTIFLDNN